MTTFEQFEVLKSKSDDAKRELQAFLHSNKRDLIKDVADKLKAIPGMNKLVIFGYTPGFNDGDACTHSSNIVFRDSWFQELAEYQCSEFDSFMGIPEELLENDEGYEWEGLTNVNNVSDDHLPLANKFMNILDYLVEETYFTDYIVMFDFTGEEVVITKEDYDCGH